MREFAKQVALQAGALLRRGQSGDLDIRYKGPADIVTDMDRAAERLILEAISERFPGHAILSEEAGQRGDAAAEYRWIIDPLDGTLNYAHRWPHWAVSIALERQGLPILGVIYAPAYGELYWAESGQGAHRDGQRLAVTGTYRLSRALLNIGSVALDPDLPLAAQPGGRLISAAFKTRQTGCCTLDLCWLAGGRTDVCLQGKTTEWDIAAGALLVAEAGGRTSSPSGAPYHLGDATFVASNGKLHDQVVEVLSWPEEVQE